MEKKWNEEVVELLNDLHELKTAEIEDTQVITKVLYTWVEQYFNDSNFNNSSILNYKITSNTYLRLTVLQKKLVISVQGFEELITINEIINSTDSKKLYEFNIGSFKSKDNKILSRKVLFDILDTFTKNAIENYEKELVYI